MFVVVVVVGFFLGGGRGVQRMREGRVFVDSAGEGRADFDRDNEEGRAE